MRVTWISIDMRKKTFARGEHDGRFNEITTKYALGIKAVLGDRQRNPSSGATLREQRVEFRLQEHAASRYLHNSSWVSHWMQDAALTPIYSRSEPLRKNISDENTPAQRAAAKVNDIAAHQCCSCAMHWLWRSSRPREITARGHKKREASEVRGRHPRFHCRI